MRSKIPFAVLVLTMSTTLLAAGVARADDEDPAKGIDLDAALERAHGKHGAP